MNHIRNFSIIAHIDHGKSTLADRIIQLCGGLSEREMEAQVLDSMDLERERGITIKAHPVTMNYKARDGHVYKLNLLDTPGHQDFSEDTYRTLTAADFELHSVDAHFDVERLAPLELSEEARELHVDGGGPADNPPRAAVLEEGPRDGDRIGATLPDHEHRAKLGNGDIFGFGVDALVGGLGAAVDVVEVVIEGE